MKKSIFIIFIFVSNLFAQQATDKNLYLTSNKVDVYAYYQSLKIGNSVLSQIAFPVNITIPVDMRMSFSIYSGLALSKYEDTEINGLGDTKIGFRYFIPGDKLIFKAIVSIPTGITELDPNQFILSQILAQNPLNYPVNYYGQGFNTSLSLVYATPINKVFILGAGFVYSYKGKFTPLKNYGEFKLGDEITADVGIEAKASNNLKFNFDVLYTIFSKDKMDNVDIFQFGNRLSLFAGVKLKTENVSHNLFVVTKIRENSKFFTKNNEEEILKNGSQVDINYIGLIPITPKLSINVKLDGKIYGTYDQFLGGDVLVTGEATVIGCTAGAKLFLSDLISADLNLGYKIGSIILPNSEVSSDISGFLANLGLTFRF